MTMDINLKYKLYTVGNMSQSNKRHIVHFASIGFFYVEYISKRILAVDLLPKEWWKSFTV
jgi:hypothetical protein